ncbi:MAG: Crp/Fnr family transcriptional regulator [Casimicrobiaceae bacterium]
MSDRCRPDGPGAGAFALLDFAPESEQHHADSGARLWRTGEFASRFAVIESGIVAIRRFTPGGDTIVLGLFGPGDAIGLPAALAREPFPAEALALAPVTLRWIPAVALNAAVAATPPLGKAVDRALIAHTDALREKIEIVSAGTVPRRLAALFLYLARRFGAPAKPGTAVIGIGLTREQIGQIVNARTETVVRVLGRWQRAGWFDGDRTRIEIARPDMLERILGV